MFKACKVKKIVARVLKKSCRSLY